VFWGFIFRETEEWKHDISDFQYYLILAEHSVPIFLHVIDFIQGAIVYNAKHIVFLALILLSYYSMNFALTEFLGKPIYNDEVLDWHDIHSIIKVAIHFILTLLIYYIICLVTKCRHQSLTKRVSKRRLTLKQGVYMDVDEE